MDFVGKLDDANFWSAATRRRFGSQSRMNCELTQYYVRLALIGERGGVSPLGIAIRRPIAPELVPN